MVSCFMARVSPFYYSPTTVGPLQTRHVTWELFGTLPRRSGVYRNVCEVTGIRSHTGLPPVISPTQGSEYQSEVREL
jgi:hypothetical protein